MRAWPTESNAANSASRSADTVASASSAVAADRASERVSREMMWIRSPKRRPRSPAAARIPEIRSAIASGGSPHIR